MIGITGGIASGKSVVGQRLQKLGALVLDADQLAHQAAEPFTAEWRRIKDVFPEVIENDFTVNRRLLAQIVFADPQKRRVLEAIIHPYVRFQLQRKAARGKKEGRHVFCEIPLLYEVGCESWFREIWVVYVEPRIQLERLMQRAQISRDLAQKMIASQLPLEEKVKKATRIIDNNFSLEHTLKQVDALWEGIKVNDKS
ncbi:MAG: dephospho-CoA kinase [Firmicutes bacterium]|nr:dephospho-CoA kinase [Bacillota bacterium]